MMMVGDYKEVKITSTNNVHVSHDKLCYANSLGADLPAFAARV